MKNISFFEFGKILEKQEEEILHKGFSLKIATIKEYRQRLNGNLSIPELEQLAAEINELRAKLKGQTVQNPNLGYHKEGNGERALKHLERYRKDLKILWKECGAILESRKAALPLDSPNRNIFNGQPLSEVREHFNTLTTLKSKANDKPIINPEQLEEFLKQAFEGVKGEKITMNKGEKDGKQIQKVFLAYYHNFAHIYPRPNNNQQEYLKLLTNYFSGWDFEKLKGNFHKMK